MRHLIALGLLAAGTMIFGCCGSVFLLATLLMPGPDAGSQSAGFAPYEGGYQSPGGFYSEPGYAPAGGWHGGHEWSGRLSSGTVDPTGQGNDVISVDGEVLTFPN